MILVPVEAEKSLSSATERMLKLLKSNEFNPGYAGVFYTAKRSLVYSCQNEIGCNQSTIEIQKATTRRTGEKRSVRCNLLFNTKLPAEK